MYTIRLKDDWLYYPADEVYALSDIELNMALNDAGYLEFLIHNNHPHYNDLELRKTQVFFYDDFELLFCGEVRSVQQMEDGRRQVYCVGELSYLYDSIQPQQVFHDVTPLQFVQALIDEHNRQVEMDGTSDRKHFTLRNVTVEDSNDSLYRYTDYETTRDALQSKVLDPLNGFMQVVHEDGETYLDIIRAEDFGHTAQLIRFGENIFSFTQNMSSDNVITALIPLGATLTREEEDPLKALPKYIDIKSVNQGIGYIYNPQAVARFGWCCKTKQWEDVNLPSILKRKAEDFLTAGQYADMSIEVTALDLSLIDARYDRFKLGKTVRVYVETFGIDVELPISEIRIIPLDPAENTYTIGSQKQTFTKMFMNKQKPVVVSSASSVIDWSEDHTFQRFSFSGEASTYKLNTGEWEEEVYTIANDVSTRDMTIEIAAGSGLIGEFLPATAEIRYQVQSIEPDTYYDCRQIRVGNFMQDEEPVEMMSTVASGIINQIGLITVPTSFEGDEDYYREPFYPGSFIDYYFDVYSAEPIDRIQPRYKMLLHSTQTHEGADLNMNIFGVRRLKTRRWTTSTPDAVGKTEEGIVLSEGAEMHIDVPLVHELSGAQIQLDIKKITTVMPSVRVFTVELVDNQGTATVAAYNAEDLSNGWQTLSINLPTIHIMEDDREIDKDFILRFKGNYVQVNNFHFYASKTAHDNNYYNDSIGW